MMVPIIASVFRLTQILAQALALAMIIPDSTIVLITYSWAGQADWWVRVPLAAWQFGLRAVWRAAGLSAF